MIDHVEVRAGAYADSVSLMQASRRVMDVDGVDSALLAMATDLNVDVLATMGFSRPDATPNDLIVAIRVDDGQFDAALAAVDAALAATRGAAGATRFGDGPPARTMRDALRRGGTFALLSVPGSDVTAEAFDALDEGRNVMIFSDNVPLDAEVGLKVAAERAGLLVLGPDAGTTMIGGVGYGFANVVQPGPVGIVAASGTGAQQISCLLDDAGVGVSHILGVGGRDLTAAVGGRSARTALRALDADPSTEHIVLLSKPPDPAVADALRVLSRTLHTPVTEALLGGDASDLTAIATQVVESVSGGTLHLPRWEGTPPASAVYEELRGWFAGGTLCDEALMIATRTLSPVRTNLAFAGAAALTDGLDSRGHVLVDLGDDAFTRGRPHPMIDQTLRIRLLRDALAADTRQVVLVDVVLGHAAHPDPAAELAPAVSALTDRGHVAVVSLCGSRDDPQGRTLQAEQLAAAGAWVFVSNAEAAEFAVGLVGRPPDA